MVYEYLPDDGPTDRQLLQDAEDALEAKNEELGRFRTTLREIANWDLGFSLDNPERLLGIIHEIKAKANSVL